MKNNQDDPSLPTQKKLSEIIPNHQDFNFEIWAMAVRQQMMSALTHKESMLNSSQPTLEKLSEEDSEDRDE